VSKPSRSRARLEQSEPILIQCEQEGGFILTYSEHESALISRMAADDLKPLHLLDMHTRIAALG
jgi:hypothetical protein